MKRDFNNCTLNITNGLNGDVIVLNDFFSHSPYIQEEILSEKVLPLLYDVEKVYITIGCKE